ncbi:MAG: hypothetical protein HYU51_10710 [Candidatus Rokubacteria bacterium]|nr:hypothetical protein [Candidatus Rokubacteria bacterium]
MIGVALDPEPTIKGRCPKTVAALVAPCLLFLVLALPFLDHPADTWEWLSLAAARQVLATGVPAVVGDERDGNHAVRPLLIHPPSSAHLMASFLMVLGDAPWAARLSGVLVAVVTALALARLVFTLSSGDRVVAARAAVLAAWLYLLHPATLQGALYLGFSDGTLLPLSWVVFLLGWTWAMTRPTRTRILVGGIGLACALWAKITTSVALPAVVGLVLLASERLVPALTLAAGTIGLGLGLFLATWSAYVLYVSSAVGQPAASVWADPFQYAFAEMNAAPSATELGVAVARVLLFLGPFLLVAAAVATGRRLARSVRERRVAWDALIPLLATAVLVAYIAVPGGVGGFPKYHLVALPLLAALAAEELAHARPGRRALVLVVLALAYQLWLVGDPLKLLNHDLRAARLEGDASSVLRVLALVVVLSALLPVALHLASRGWRDAVLTAILGSHLALILLQASGGYFLKHWYGTPVEDFRRVVALIRAETPPASAILALPEFGYHSRRRIVPGAGRHTWGDARAIEALVRGSAPSAVVYGLPTHTVVQMRGLSTDPALASTLGRGYRRIDVGEFTVWLPAS